MIDRVVDRLPALLLLAVVALGAHVAIIEAKDWRLLTASVPAFLLFVLYLRSGPGTGGGGGGGRGGGKSGKGGGARSEARAAGRASR
jgi:uncharacterized membrane protein YgcG